MIAWAFLAVAILTEVAATLSLRMAVKAQAVWYVPVVVGYVIAFSALSLALRNGMPLGVAYGIWTAVGVALVAVAGRVLFGERFTWVVALGIALIAGGVLLVEIGHTSG